MQVGDQDYRAYADLKRLVDLQVQAKGFDLFGSPPIQNILSGRHASRLRGRGLSFEELRAYRVGDDVRNLDWKVTNRTRKPHVRVYSEERERDVVLLVDQRSSMFFGSQQYMKSVIAAELAALAVWRSLSVNDRVGALVFNDDSIDLVKPQRSTQAGMRVLHHIVTMNHQLSAAQKSQNSGQLNLALSSARRICRHDCLIVVISDLHGWNEQTVEQLKRLKVHNDLVVSRVLDPMEQHLPQHRHLVLSDGALQIQVDSHDNDISKSFNRSISQHLVHIESQLFKYRIPFMPIDTLSSANEQLVLAKQRQNMGDS